MFFIGVLKINFPAIKAIDKIMPNNPISQIAELFASMHTQPIDFLVEKWENPAYLGHSRQAKMMKKDTLPFSHGTKGSHMVCKARLEKMGIMSTCCVCDPHYDCDVVKKSVFIRRRHPNFIDKAIENIGKKIVGKSDEEVQSIIDSLIEEEWIIQQNRWMARGEEYNQNDPNKQQGLWLDKVKYFLT